MNVNRYCINILNNSATMKKLMYFAYGLLAYAIFFASFCFAVGFVVNLIVPNTLDGEPGSSLSYALLVDSGLLLLFAVQHSTMARPWFKKWWTRYIPEALERSTYVLLSSVCLIVLLWLWEPIGGAVWSAGSPAVRVMLTALSLTGFAIVLVSTFLINHFDLFGLRQVWFYFRGIPYVPLTFRTPLFYKYVRHPLYLGWMIAFWATPTMTVAHLLFAALTTGYMLTAIRFEERDLIRVFGEKYIRYRQTAAMLIPFTKRRI
jgi:protein-S-isoprenylcysteine O-methyltransferase Ste14